jgi:YesN/AraC family two-component response regulator
MYKVMIIDDETALRNLLKRTISWEAKNLSVVCEAASGIEAINIIDDYKPDIAFVDIRMPFMDGIEFAKLAIARYPKLKILILTAFDDFKYAKECIGIGVTDYLLKPIVRTDIESALDRVIKVIDGERMKEEETDRVNAREIGSLAMSGDESNSSAKQAENGSIKMEQVQKYLKENYKDSKLNLTAVADYFGFNSSYLSRKFKEEMKMGLVDCLTGIRMEKATKLAQSGKLMYMTAEEVGIPDPNYFGKLFKKYKGMSYSDYQTR